MKTFVLILFLGFTPPVVVEDYESDISCKDAGDWVVNQCSVNPNRKCSYFCLPGPKKNQ